MNRPKSQDGNWAARAAFWEKNAPKGESVTDELNQLLIELTDIEAGDHVLDLASGAGEPAISIALRVGKEGLVTALDAHAEMLAGAKLRASTLGLTNMKFEIAPMEDLPFGDDRFDAVTCRFGLMSSDDPPGTLRETRRVLKPEGKAAFMTHGVRERNTLSAVTEQVVQDFLGEQYECGAARQLRFSEAGSLQAVFAAAGLVDVGEREILRTVTRERSTRFWQGLLERRYGTWIEPLNAEQQTNLNAALEMAFEPYLKGDQYELLSSDMVGWGTA